MALTERIGIIQTELTGDPLVRGYAAMTDAQAAADLNTAYRPRDRDIAALQEYVFNTAHNPAVGTRTTTSVWVLCEDLSEGKTITDTVPTEQHIDAARALLLLIRRPPDSSWDLTSANLDTLLSRLVAADAMSEADRTAIKALSENRISRAQELGLGTVSASDINDARIS